MNVTTSVGKVILLDCIFENLLFKKLYFIKTYTLDTLYSCVVYFNFSQLLQVFDSFAGELGPSLFSKFELPVLKQIAKSVKEKLLEMNLDAVPMVRSL